MKNISAKHLDLNNLANIISAEERKGQALPADIDAQIAALLEVPIAPFTTSFDAAYQLLDAVSTGEDYVNVDYREYRKNGYVLCDINRDVGDSFEGNGSGRNRIVALVAAIVSAVSTAKMVEEDEA
jgi:hypothetical protein